MTSSELSFIATIKFIVNVPSHESGVCPSPWGVIRFSLICCLLAAVPCAAQNPDYVAPFLGKWQSNRELTLLDVAKHPQIPEKERRLHKTEDVFGRLVLIMSRRWYASYFADEKGKEPLTFVPHKIVDSGPGFVVFESPSQLDGRPERTRFDIDGRCIFTLVGVAQYREYFCPVD